MVARDQRWRVEEIRDYITITAGQHILAENYNTDKIGQPYVTGPSDFRNGVLTVTKYTDRPKAVATAGSVLVTVKGSGAGLVLRNGAKDVAISRQLVAIESSQIDNDYLYHSLCNKLPELQSKALGNLIPGLSQKDIKELPIPLPPLPEQRAIAGALGEVDALLAALDGLVAKKEAVKRGVMEELLGGERRLAGFKASDSFGIEKARKNVQLGNILTVCHGKSQHEVAVSNGQYPILATGGEIGRASSYLYDQPSVLIGRKGTIDRPTYIDIPFWTIDTLFYTEIHHANAKYVYYLFQMIPWYSYNEASGVPSLNAGTIESIEVAIPPIEEQQAIAALLSDLDTELEALRARREKLAQLKAGMMGELLTGRVRLVTDSD